MDDMAIQPKTERYRFVKPQHSKHFRIVTKFLGSNKHIALQVGNAVPVVLAEELGKHILQLVSDCGKRAAANDETAQSP